MARDLRTITVGELIDLLEDYDADTRVIFSTDYGDYHHTPQALPLKGEAEETLVEPSAYSNSGFAVKDDDDEDDDDPESGEGYETYLLIR